MSDGRARQLHFGVLGGSIPSSWTTDRGHVPVTHVPFVFPAARHRYSHDLCQCHWCSDGLLLCGFEPLMCF
jgi:hypothetical protein